MKNQEYVEQEYRKACRYCEHGQLSSDQTVVLCPKKGIVETDYLCKKYVYDPLKRVPQQPRATMTDFSAEDFSL
ncbi:MAG: hypothetical protein IKT68_05305 [Clostridia bacterium]|nr:hypothetical protein [Clostridia bacterium]